MNNQLALSRKEFERQKNVKASVITAAVTLVIFLIFIWYKLSIPQQQLPVVDEYIEVNLGSGNEGFGTDQPLLPGDPAAAQQVSYTPPQPVNSNEESVRDVSSENEHSSAPPVIKPANSNPTATKINSESKTTRSNTNTTQPVAPTPQRPRAVLGRTTGGNGNGGNGADSYKPGGNEGIAGGSGDQGSPGGDPNSRNYTGSPRKFQNLNVVIDQSFKDDFNSNGKVALDIVVDANGKVISATYQPLGSTMGDSKHIEIARRHAFKLKSFNPVQGGQKGTVIFNFKVN